MRLMIESRRRAVSFTHIGIPRGAAGRRTLRLGQRRCNLFAGQECGGTQAARTANIDATAGISVRTE